MFETEQSGIEQQILEYCASHSLPEPILRWSWIPFSGQWGLSTSFFQLAAASFVGQKGDTPQRAQEIAEGIAELIGIPQGFSKVEAVKGYLNLTFDPALYTQRVVDTVLEQGSQYGRAPRLNEQVMVEFSQPNTHKAFHVGHLRSAILGDVLSNLLDAAGFDVVRANYPGDMGLHVIKWLWNYEKFHLGEKPGRDITRWMGDLYSEASKRLEENPELDNEVREVYKRWDSREPALVALWKETRQWSLEGFTEMYQQLGIQFDRYYFNSMFEDSGREMVEDLIHKGIADDERLNQGPVVVKLDEKLGLKTEKYRVFVILRSDGTALYATEDLALARQKFTDYPHLTRSYYVVDVRQSLHFTQVFKTLELAGYDWATRCQHVPYEIVSLPGNVVMSSREGSVVLLEDLLREATQRALQVVREKNPELSEESKQEIARAVGIGAIKYPMLTRDNTKVVTFDWESALDFNGQAAPYIQYAGVRANSILRKAGTKLPGSLLPEHLLTQPEVVLIDLIGRLPNEIQNAARDLRPLVLTTLAYDLAKAFNDFYTQCPVLQAEETIKNSRLRLVAAAKQAMANSLALLGITAPQAM
jgi:arginyl-tRNA synthetase